MQTPDFVIREGFANEVPKFLALLSGELPQ
jgi:hypothetical protein